MGRWRDVLQSFRGAPVNFAVSLRMCCPYQQTSHPASQQTTDKKLVQSKRLRCTYCCEHLYKLDLLVVSSIGTSVAFLIWLLNNRLLSWGAKSFPLFIGSGRLVFLASDHSASLLLFCSPKMLTNAENVGFRRRFELLMQTESLLLKFIFRSLLRDDLIGLRV